METNFRPKHPCSCPKVAKLSDNDLIQDAKLRMVRETEKNNIPITDADIQNSDQSRLQTPSRQISHHSDWSDSEDGKDDQARAKPIDTKDPQPKTSFASYASEAAPLR